ncbi:MAG: hypothetical protein ACYDGY_10955 [Acidimicrobiales bacterium]
MPETASIVEAILRLQDTFDESNIPYGFGGGIALAYYAEPRATQDVDVGIFLPATKSSIVRIALEGIGEFSDGWDQRVIHDGFGVVTVLGINVDCFFSSHAIHDEMASMIRRVPFADSTIPIISAEHLVILKALFNRTKDWSDIEMIIDGCPALDINLVRTWLIRAGAYEARQKFEAALKLRHDEA